MPTVKKTKRRNASFDDEAYQYKPTKKDNIRCLLKRKIKLEAKSANQTLFMNALRDKSKSLVIASGISGCGKAQPLTTPVLTPDGWKPMGEIKTGDKVITANGTPTDVTGVFPQGKKEIYRVSFDDGTSTECCNEHLWLTQTYLDRRHINKKSGFKEQRVATVKSTKEIFNSIVYNDHTNHSIPVVSPIQFTTKDFKIDPYLLGSLLGDGSLVNKVMFSSADMESITELQLILGNDYILKHYKNHDFNIKAAKGKKNHLLFTLRELGLIGCKSETKFVPKEYLFGDVNQRLALLQGLMDTDGTISKNGIKIEFSSSSEELASNVVALVQSLGGIARQSTKKTHYTKNGERIHCLLSHRVSISMNPELIPFRLSRKVERYIPRTTYLPKRFIKSVEKIGEEEAQCIMVADESHLYITNDFIVTHNTFLSIVESLNLLFDENNGYEEIVIFKSIKMLDGEDMGFLPGDKDEKLQYIYQSFFMQLEKLMSPEILKKLYEDGIIKVLPLGAIRGVSINPRTIVIVDEVQNLSVEKVHTVITRMEEGSKLICIGDVYQRDHKNKSDNGLLYLNDNFKEISPSIEVVEFCKEDSVRSPLIAMFQDIFERHLDSQDVQKERKFLRG